MVWRARSGGYAQDRRQPAADEIVRALGLPEVRERLHSVGSTPDEFAAIIKSEITKWTKIVRAAKISAE